MHMYRAVLLGSAVLALYSNGTFLFADAAPADGAVADGAAADGAAGDGAALPLIPGNNRRRLGSPASISLHETKSTMMQKNEMESAHRRLYYDPKTVQLRTDAAVNDPSLRPISEVVLTSWYTFSNDPQRKGFRVSAASIEYMYNLYTSATHLKVPLVVFHDALSPEFVARYTNEYVMFIQVEPDPKFSTNDFRFTPYLEYILKNDVSSALMVDASDVFFNRNPFEYFHQHADKYNLFVSRDQGTFAPGAWNVNQCYGEQPKEWDPTVKMMNAGVWGGTGDGLRCVLQCVVDQLAGPLRGRGRNNNCNMPAVNYCISQTIGPCGAPGANIVAMDPDPNESFVNPWKMDCLGDYSIVHNKCSDTSALICPRGNKPCRDAEQKLCIDSVDGGLIKDRSRPMCSRDDFKG